MTHTFTTHEIEIELSLEYLYKKKKECEPISKLHDIRAAFAAFFVTINKPFSGKKKTLEL